MTLEPRHNHAIRDEIGERLKTMLAGEPPNLPPDLDQLVHRFVELDHDASPSIVPDAGPEAERPEPAPTSAWLQRLRDFTRKS
jgi:hypothetical protein